MLFLQAAPFPETARRISGGILDGRRFKRGRERAENRLDRVSADGKLRGPGLDTSGGRQRGSGPARADGNGAAEVPLREADNREHGRGRRLWLLPRVRIQRPAGTDLDAVDPDGA